MIAARMLDKSVKKLDKAAGMQGASAKKLDKAEGIKGGRRNWKGK
jgi:hypothetical protein